MSGEPWGLEKNRVGVTNDFITAGPEVMPLGFSTWSWAWVGDLPGDLGSSSGEASPGSSAPDGSPRSLPLHSIHLPRHGAAEVLPLLAASYPRTRGLFSNECLLIFFFLMKTSLVWPI